MGDTREQVRERYARAAQRTAADDCCGSGSASGQQVFGIRLYDATDLVGIPLRSQDVSLGCGTPLDVADLREGERVLDLGSGAGVDVLLSARRVGPTGFVHGVDMTEEMLELARASAAEVGATNVEFHLGVIEDLPLPDQSVDVVISNCVVNLSPDKERVLREAFRVIAPGGRIGISDVVAEDRLSVQERVERGRDVGCVAGALSRSEYLHLLESVGFRDASVELTQPVADGMHGAVVRAARPAPEVRS
ncbi:arsenite methyltransferase [Cellulomonas sp. JH27-2]|uniref:arsenite methyltransferase n=1 Tax=Cellulomonas sp. JH27-2 TaxID=2774139 RepID=UPI0017842DD6|nr:arsenite methyltransferase [Cellulomonas sp. JH27-2]MBD8057947.1 arsenite methyltransferase [Cellulomonas sp. JH27-2]